MYICMYRERSFISLGRCTRKIDTETQDQAGNAFIDLNIQAFSNPLATTSQEQEVPGVKSKASVYLLPAASFLTMF